MPQEVRVLREGELRWVQAGSGTGGLVGTGWITAATPASGLIGFVQAGFDANKQWTLQTIYDRGFPKHNKITQYQAIPFNFTVLYAVTADWPPMQPQVTASGFSLPMYHLEWRQMKPEVAGKDVPFGSTADYMQLHNCTLLSLHPNEAENGNTIAFNGMALAMVFPTGSGFLA